MRALPYTLKNSLWEIQGSTLWLNSTEDPLDPDTLSPRILRFILTHAQCARCAAPMESLESHASCSSKARRYADVEARISHANGMREILREELDVFNRGKLHLLRRRKLAAGERHTAAQLRALLSLQQKRCFYCFTQLFDFGRRANTNLDHFQSVANGGTNGIKNLRYACASCNADKSAGDGIEFQQMKLRLAPPEVAQQLRAMQAAVESCPF